LSTAIGLTPGGSSTVNVYTKTLHLTTQINNRTKQITTNLKECGPYPVFACFTLAFALQLRKKHGKPSLRVKTSVRVWITLESKLLVLWDEGCGLYLEGCGLYLEVLLNIVRPFGSYE